jgi:hypothetical protein
MSSHQSEYQSQRAGTPADIAALLNSDNEDDEGSIAAPLAMSNQGGSQAGGSQLPQKPIFQAVNGDAPTRAELVQHANEV